MLYIVNKQSQLKFCETNSKWQLIAIDQYEFDSSIILSFLKGLQNVDFERSFIIMPIQINEGALQIYHELGAPKQAILNHLPYLLEALPSPKVDNLLNLIAMTLCERSIILVSDRLDQLTSSILSLVELLNPMTWQFILAPILPETLLDRLDAPVPFIAGITTESFQKLNKMDFEFMGSYTWMFLQDKVVYETEFDQMMIGKWLSDHGPIVEQLERQFNQDEDIFETEIYINLIRLLVVEGAIKSAIAKEYDFVPPHKSRVNRKFIESNDLIGRVQQSQMFRQYIDSIKE